MSGEPFVLSAYPLSRDYRSSLDERIGPNAEYLTLTQLRRIGAVQLIATLRRLRGRQCILAFEDPASASILPVLQLLASAARPSRVDVSSADGSSVQIRGRELVPALGRLTSASVRGLVATGVAQRRIARLRAVEPATETQLDVVSRRALYLNSNLWFGLKAGGSVGHVAGVINGLLDDDFEVDVFTATEPVLVRPEAHVVTLDPPAAFGVPHEVNFQSFQDRALKTVVENARPPYDFVYQRHSVASSVGVRVARRLGVPLVLEYNGSEVWAARHWGRPLRFEQLAQSAEDLSLQHASRIVTVSDVLRDELIERGIAPERIGCYPNCVDVEMYDGSRFSPTEIAATRARHGIRADAVVATFIGTFGLWHGAERFAQAIADLVAADEAWVREHRLHFLLVGDGVRMPDVARIVAESGAAEFVTLTGLVPQVEGPAYLAASDILVSPHVPNPDGTPFFGSPTKLFEYLATGRAILASDLNQIGDVLRPSLRASNLPDGEPDTDSTAIAVLAQPGDAAEIIRGLRFLVGSPAWRRALGERARSLAEDRYTWRRHVKVVLGLD